MTTVLKGVEGVVRGYRPQVDWGGEEGSPTIVVGGHNVKLGTSGWRKRCLFILLGSLLLIAVINLVMTFYLLKKIHFHTEGAGDLHIEIGGVRLDGISRLDNALTASNIRGRPADDLEITGYYNLTIATTTAEGQYGSGAVLDPESGLKVAAKSMKVKNGKGKLLFEAKENGIDIGAKFLTITGEGGADFESSLQTPRILGDEVHEFRIESKTRSVIGRAAALLRIESRAGDVTVTSLGDASLGARNGKFRFESPNVFLPNLVVEEGADVMSTSKTAEESEFQIPSPDIAEPTTSGMVNPGNGAESDSGDELITVYQVCVCPNGKLFLSSADFICNPDEFTCR